MTGCVARNERCMSLPEAGAGRLLVHQASHRIVSMPATIKRSAQNSNTFRTHGIISSHSVLFHRAGGPRSSATRSETPEPALWVRPEATTGETPDAERKTVMALFADIKGSMELID